MKVKKAKKSDSILKKLAVNKRVYIALFVLAAIVGGSVYVRGLQERLTREIVSFDDEAWQQAVKESGIEIVDVDKPRITSDVDSTDSEVKNAENTETVTEKKEEDVVTESAVETAVEAEQPFSMDMPCSGSVMRDCSLDELLFCSAMDDWRTHNGIDIRADLGEPLYATADGVVSRIYEDSLLGTTLELDHQNGIVSVYGNIQNADFIRVGTAVQKGEVVGGVGSSGILEADGEPHLHFEVKCDGEYKDPMEYMKN